MRNRKPWVKTQFDLLTISNPPITFSFQLFKTFICSRSQGREDTTVTSEIPPAVLGAVFCSNDFRKKTFKFSQVLSGSLCQETYIHIR